MKDKAPKPTERENKSVPIAPTLSDDDHEELLALLRAQTDDGRRIRKHLHEQVAGGVYRSLMNSPSKTLPDAEQTLVCVIATEYAADVVKRMNPRDPLEEMLTLQAL